MVFESYYGLYDEISFLISCFVLVKNYIYGQIFYCQFYFIDSFSINRICSKLHYAQYQIIPILVGLVLPLKNINSFLHFFLLLHPYTINATRLGGHQNTH